MRTANSHLAEVCEINPTTSFNFDSDQLCSFVPMEAVDEEFAQVTKFPLKRFHQVAKGYTAFADNDVIVAKITPCMENGKCAVVRNLRNGVGFGSTEFHVLRATTQVLPEWLFYFWRFPQTRKHAEKNMTGTAGQKRVPSSFLERLDIPVPPLREQERIAALLKKADRLRRTRRYARQLSDTFLQSVFLEIFGDTSNLLNRWEHVPFRELVGGEMRNGLSPSKKGTIEARVLTLSAITRGEFDPQSQKVAFFERQPPSNQRVSAAEFLVCRGKGNLHLVGSGKFPHRNLKEVVFPDTMIAATPDTALINRKFLETLWSGPSIRRQIESAARTTNGTYKINQESLGETEVPAPPLPLQQKFADIVCRFERLRAQQREAERQAEHLFQTLLHRAFKEGI